MAASHGFAEQVEDFSFLSDALVYQLHWHCWRRDQSCSSSVEYMLHVYCSICVSCIEPWFWDVLFLGQLELQKPQGGGEKIEEDFTLARLYISKMKSEAKTLMQHCSQLETFQAENNKKLDETESQLSACKLLIQQVSILISCIQYQLRAFTVVLMTCALLVLQICCNSFWKDEYVFLDSWYFIISDCDRLYFPVYRRQQIVIDMKSWTRKLPN